VALTTAHAAALQDQVAGVRQAPMMNIHTVAGGGSVLAYEGGTAVSARSAGPASRVLSKWRPAAVTDVGARRIQPDEFPAIFAFVG
jgi:N-methylhydantoinase A/oxoprolinase/acetone carboxylase beta subunit